MFAMGPGFFGAANAPSYDTLAITGAFPGATVGTAYDEFVTISGGETPYTLTGGTGVASGSLPVGLSLSIQNTDELHLSGTPTTAGTAGFTASVDSSDGQTATSVQSVVVASVGPDIRGLIALYKLDETSGTVAYDSSGNGNHGAYVGGNVTRGLSSILPSGGGKGVSFGSQSYVSLPNGILAAVGRPFTIFGWGKNSNPASTRGQQIMCSATGGFNFFLYSSNVCGGIAGVSINITDSRTIASDTVHFWALVVDASGNANIYDNEVPSTTASGAFSSSDRFANAVVVGNYSDADSQSFFDGTLQNVGVCNVALTQAEISAIYASS